MTVRKVGGQPGDELSALKLPLDYTPGGVVEFDRVPVLENLIQTREEMDPQGMSQTLLNLS